MVVSSDENVVHGDSSHHPVLLQTVDNAGNGQLNPNPIRALILINLQVDWVDGSVAVPGGLAVAQKCTELRKHSFDYVYVCDTLHPVNHCSFRSNHPGARVGEVLYLSASGDSQRMWPDHCINGTKGARPHPSAPREPGDIHIATGRDPRKDSFSAFKDNGSRELSPLAGSLGNHGVNEIYVAGLATDHAVQHTVDDALLLVEGIQVFVVQDACRGTDKYQVERALEALRGQSKVNVIRSDGPEMAKIAPRRLRTGSSRVLELVKSRTAHHISTHSKVDQLYEAILLDSSSSKKMELISEVVHRGLVNTPCSWSSRSVLHACAHIGDHRTLSLLCQKTRFNDSNIRSASLHDESLNLLAVSSQGENALIACILRCPRRAAKLEFIRTLLNLATAEECRVLLTMTSTLELRMNALMCACHSGDLDIAEMLLNVEHSFAYLRARARYGVTALMLAAAKDTSENAALIEHILSSQPPGQDRLTLVSQADCEKWNVLSIASKSGCFAKVNWVRAMGGRQYLRRMPVNSITAGAGFTMLQLAAWNGNDQVIRSIIDMFSFQGAPSSVSLAGNSAKTRLSVSGKLAGNLNIHRGAANGVREKIMVNRAAYCTSDRAQGDAELDLAIQQQHLECARLLLRLGCHANSRAGASMQELLHRLVLMGDLEGCEAILDFPDENGIVVDEALVVVTQRMKTPETCTFSFSNSTHPAKQFLAYCELCDRHVCLICKDKCHGTEEGMCTPDGPAIDHEDHKNGITGMAVHYCECLRASCCAGAVGKDDREKTARTFIPDPVDTQDILLDYSFHRLLKRLAHNSHNVWARDKVQSGWTHSKTRDDNLKHHPLLVPFDALADEDREHNLDVAAQGVKVIIALGFSLMMQSKTKSNQIRSPGRVSNTAKQQNKSSGTPNEFATKLETAAARHASLYEGDSSIWHESTAGCAPIDTHSVELPPLLLDLAEHIAKNSHQVWAAEKISKGWRYAPAHKIHAGLKLTSDLVPFEALSEHGKISLRQGAIEMLKTITMDGWVIVKELDCGGNLSLHNFDASIQEESQTFRSIGNGRSSLTSSVSSGTSSKRRASGLSSATRRTSPVLKTADVCHNVAETRTKFFEQYLFATARRGHLKSLHILISTQRAAALLPEPNKSNVKYDGSSRKHLKHQHQQQASRNGPNLNVQDSFGQTPLYISVKRGHFNMVKWLLSLNVDVDLSDVNGISPLAIAAYLGNERLCRELIAHDANLLSTDRMGFTPIHHAAYQGNEKVCALIAESLQVHYQTNHIINLNARLHASKHVSQDDAAVEKKAKFLRRDSSIMGAAMVEDIAAAPKLGTTANKIRKRLARLRRQVAPAPPQNTIVKRAASVKSFGNQRRHANAGEDEDDEDDEGEHSDYDDSFNPSSLEEHDAVAHGASSFVFVTPGGSVRSPGERANSDSSDGSHLGRGVKKHAGLVGVPENVTPHSPLSMAVFAEQHSIVELLLGCDADPMFADGLPRDSKRGSGMVSPYVRALRKHMVARAKVVKVRTMLAERASIERRVKMETSSYARDGSKSTESDRRKHGRRFIGSAFGARSLLKGSVQNSSDKRSSASTSAAAAEEQFNVRHLNQVLEETTVQCNSVTSTIKALNTSTKVRQWRNRLAIATFFHDIFTLGCLIAVFTGFVQLAPDYDNASELIWKMDLTTQMQDSLTDVGTRQDLLDWLDGFALNQMRYDNQTGVLSLYQYNHVYGAIKIERIDHPFHALEFDTERASLLGTLTGGVDSNLPEEYRTVYFLTGDKQNISATIKASTLSHSLDLAQQISVTINLHNPFYELFGVITVQLLAPFHSTPATTVEVQQFRLHHGRFPPSREFQAVTFFLFVYIKLRGRFSRQRKLFAESHAYSFLHDYNLWALLLFGLGVLDVFIYSQCQGLDINPGVRTKQYKDLSSAYALIAFERRTIGLGFFLMMVPVLTACRSIPSIGPVVVALLNTISSKSVIIYLAVVGAAYVLISMAMFQAFGADVQYWHSLAATYTQLFLTPFIETWEGATDAYATSGHGALLAVVYIFFAVVSTNLMIAVVTDVYPAEREKSESQWEELITASIERKVAADAGYGVTLETETEERTSFLVWCFRVLKLKPWFLSPKSAQGPLDALQIPYWRDEQILCGKDGIKCWVRPNIGPLQDDVVPPARGNPGHLQDQVLKVDTSDQISSKITTAAPSPLAMRSTLHSPLRSPGAVSVQSPSVLNPKLSTAQQNTDHRLARLEAKLDQLISIYGQSFRKLEQEPSTASLQAYTAEQQLRVEKILERLVLESVTQQCSITEIKSACVQADLPWSLFNFTREKLGITEHSSPEKAIVWMAPSKKERY